MGLALVGLLVGSRLLSGSLDTRQKAPFVADLAELFGAEVHVVSISTLKNKRDLTRLTIG